MSALAFVIVDVFTDRPLEGNQLAVFGDGAAVPDHLLQPLAKEIGFSETVFVYPPTMPGADARARIFTPDSELPFAGHPVLGTAVWLAGERSLPAVRLETGAGIVPVEVAAGFGRMTQPLPTWSAFPTVTELLAALGIATSALPVDVYDNGVRHVYVGLGSEDEVAALAPDLGAVRRVTGATGVNCFAGSGTRWKTRMFGPGLGVSEDPATGSAAGPLAVHLARHGAVPWGTEIVVSQGVEIGRPSTLHAVARGSDAGVDAVEVAGHAVVVGRGEFQVG